MPTVKPPPRERVAGLDARGKSVEDSTWKVEALWPDPIVTEPATNVKVCAVPGLAVPAMIAPAVVHTTVVVGLKVVPVIPAVVHPRAVGVVTRVTVNVVSVFFKAMAEVADKVRVSTPLARAAVTVDPEAQLVVQEATELASNEKPERGMATCVTPVTTAGMILTVNVAAVETVVTEVSMAAGTDL